MQLGPRDGNAFLLVNEERHGGKEKGSVYYVSIAWDLFDAILCLAYAGGPSNQNYGRGAAFWPAYRIHSFGRISGWRSVPGETLCAAGFMAHGAHWADMPKIEWWTRASIADGKRDSNVVRICINELSVNAGKQRTIVYSVMTNLLENVSDVQTGVTGL